MNTTRSLLMIAALAGPGCYTGGPQVAGEDEDPPGRVPTGGGSEDDGSATDDGADSGEPGHHGEGEAEEPAGRRMRRMTAIQFHRSLVTVTGQPWPFFDEFARAMGQADYAEITEEGLELSVTFDKFVHDAALHSCAAAIAADLAGSDAGIVLRWVAVSERDEVKIRRNLDYMMLRFLGQEMQDEDPRVEPWMTLLTASPDEDEPFGDIDDELMRERWTAVCMGLVTHPDFVTY
jgi:hypothetical protein